MHTVSQLMKGDKQDKKDRSVKDKNRMPGDNNSHEEPVEEKSEKIYKMPGNGQGKDPEQQLPPGPDKTDKKIPNLRNGIK